MRPRRWWRAVPWADLWEVLLALVGVGLVTTGLWLVSVPVALVVLGLAVLAWAYLGSSVRGAR